MNKDAGCNVSVCLLTYNHVNVVESTINTILDQTLEGYEVLVSDDCSTDGTWEVVEQLQRRIPSVRAVQPDCNLGMAGNANFAVAQASRKYVALLHHDDVYRCDLLERWVDTLELHDDIGFVFNPYGVHGSDTIFRWPLPTGRIDGRWFLKEYLLRSWSCPVRGTAMIRREAWSDVGGMRTEFGMLGDIDLWMRLARNWAVGYVDAPLISIRQQRPAYYPDAYSNWSWERQRLMYEIHAANRRETLDRETVSGKVAWNHFRARVALETAKWLAYAVLRGKHEMIATSDEGRTDFDLMPIQWLRSSLRRAYCAERVND